MAKRWQKKDSKPALPALTLGFSVAPWRTWLPQALLILAAGLYIYGPALHGGWLWDDDHYLTDNPLMPDPLGFWKVWAHRGPLRDYCPLTASVQWIQWQLWANHTLGYHLTNLALHFASAFLLWKLLARLGLPLAWIGALLFTVHPLMIESVAWISELKNTLSLPLLLLAILTWLAWEKDRAPRLYLGSVLLFVLSLLAKPTGMMLPVLLLAHAWATRGTITARDLQRAAPLFAASFILGLVSLTPPPLPPGTGGVHAPWNILSALASTGWALVFMLGKCLVPVRLMPVYPSFAIITPTAFDLLPWLALVAFTALLWFNRAGWSRPLLLGFGFFLLNLLPVLGYTLIHYPNMVWSLDHLLYLPILGLIALVVFGLGQLRAQIPALGRAASALLFLAILAIAFSAHAYAGWYAGWDQLWTHELRAQPTSRIALLNVASISVAKNDFATALPYLREAVRLEPTDPDAGYDLGLALDNLGQKDQAQAQYRAVIQQNPAYAKAYVSLAGLLLKSGDAAQAESLYRQGLQHTPDDAPLCINLGSLLMKQGRTAEVIDLYQRALVSSPDLAQLHYNLGLALLGAGKLPDAAQHLQTAVDLDPKLTAAHENLGVVLAQSGRIPEAIDQFQAVIDLNPQAVAARDNLALALVQTGHLPEAIDQFEQVLRIDPNDAKARAARDKLRQFQLQQAH